MFSSSQVSPSGHDESDYTGCDGGDEHVLAPGAVLLVPGLVEQGVELVEYYKVEEEHAESAASHEDTQYLVEVLHTIVFMRHLTCNHKCASLNCG